MIDMQTRTKRGAVDLLDDIVQRGDQRDRLREVQFEREADQTHLPCLTPGLRVTTRNGARAVEDLVPGEHVLTRANGFQPLLWIGQREVSGDLLTPALRPIRVMRDAFAPGVPKRPLVVAPRVHVTTHPADATAPMVPVGWLVGDTGIEAVETESVVYVVLAFEAREVIQVEGTWVEAHALSDRHGSGTAMLLSVFPELGYDEAVLMHPVNRDRT
ncbi:Hint domain-containing protein [uncultured Maritimibacter sp.]|jgi:hypothetical protein|uniref:Hint domain-containing protein n=1 Tax=uncultured Maritimibacter sp. TaxID=991866 RepID=UPI002622DAB0|nr:Hint domain-containing protein [uncultured Maritimibacter sp.]